MKLWLSCACRDAAEWAHSAPTFRPANTRRASRQPGTRLFMEASIDHQFDEDRLFLRPLGEWVIDEANRLDQKLRDVFRSASRPPRRLVIDLSKVDHLDTAGAFLLVRIERRFIGEGGKV